MYMTYKNTILGVAAVAVMVGAGLLAFFSNFSPSVTVDPTPQNVTLSGTYVCLPHLDTTGPQTEECKFGLKTDDGTYYAVNFGQSAQAMQLFQSGARITAEGFTIIKEALSTNEWATYNMKGIFTITRMIDSVPVQGKLYIHTICDETLAYMTFPDGNSAEKFGAECKEGKHPEVIEQYKMQMGLGDGAAI